MGLFKREQLWDTLDDIGHYNGSIPWYSTWRSRQRGAVMFWICFLVAGIFIGFIYRQDLNLTWGKLKTGDQLFADSSALKKDSKHYAVTLYRRIRPINAEDIKKMDIQEWKKSQLISQLDTSADHNQPAMKYAGFGISQDSMFKHKTAYIGSYIKKDSTTIKYYADGSGSSDDWYAIKVNFNLVKKGEFEMPANFVFADEYYYVDPLDVRLTEPAAFKNKLSTTIQNDTTRSTDKLKSHKHKLGRKHKKKTHS
ncbi:hypothetical protein [Mucilaginibacter lacusdianchii]|uniref:hypothetical protein n=1 Tax=Mucilaginibacter lacusdianchii TaxID=2684211 RepID=UPI00131E694E|nr:hypothetical protein [Mucilaginibacter sp. JXJ CY 39]